MHPRRTHDQFIVPPSDLQPGERGLPSLDTRIAKFYPAQSAMPRAVARPARVAHAIPSQPPNGGSLLTKTSPPQSARFPGPEACSCLLLLVFVWPWPVNFE